MCKSAIIAVICSISLVTTPVFADDLENWTSFPNMNYITGLAEATDVIYVATTGGIRRYDRFARQWLPPLTTRDGLPGNNVQRVAYDAATGDLWFDTRNGTGRYLSGLQIVMRGGVFPANLSSHAVPQMPSLFPPFGYYLESNRIIAPDRQVAITDALIDSWRIFWLGTWGLGVGRADLNDQQLEFLPSGPLAENISALAKDGDAIWIGGENTFQKPARGITVFHPKAGAWQYYEADQIIGLDDAQITTILPDDQTVWFGTHSGLTRYSKRAKRWLVYRDSRHWGRINTIARDGNTLWLGSDRGLALLDVKADSLDQVSGSENAVIEALVTGPRFVWAGTEAGVFHAARGKRTWRPIASEFAKRPVRALAISGDHLWVATETPPSLVEYHTVQHTWREFPLAEIGSGLRITVAADTSRVWVGTASGAFLLDVPRQIWTHYTPIHGLIHARVQAVLRDGKHLWFGTANGLSRFDWTRALFVENE